MIAPLNFGAALYRFRNERGLSLRELSTLSDVDHAYIHRLESGDKSAPSPDVLDRLSRGLKLTAHKRKIFDLLTEINEIDALLFEIALKQPERHEVVKAAAKMSFRGARPESESEWEKKLAQIEELTGHGGR